MYDMGWSIRDNQMAALEILTYADILIGEVPKEENMLSV